MLRNTRKPDLLYKKMMRNIYRKKLAALAKPRDNTHSGIIWTEYHTGKLIPTAQNSVAIFVHRAGGTGECGIDPG